MESRLNTIEKKIFYLFYNFTKKNKIVKRFAVFMVITLPYLVFLSYLIGLIYLIFYKFSYLFIFKYLLAPLLAFFFARLIRTKLNAKRPYEQLEIENFIYHKGGNSFPSNHSAVSMAIAMCLTFLINVRLCLFYVPLSFFIGISRIMVGLHFFRDILGGILIGGFVGYFVCIL